MTIIFLKESQNLLTLKMEDIYFAAFLIVALLAVIAYKFNNIWVVVMDWFRLKKRVKFEDLDQIAQDQITSKAFCPSCETVHGMAVESEEDINGMMFLHGNCPECNGPIKLRMK